MASGSAEALSITIPGWTDVTGHTEYIIKSSVGEHHYAVQHRFSNFIDLHEALAAKLSKLPAAFPVAKSMFSGDSVKRQRVEALQDYLRSILKLSEGRTPPSALLKFLRVEASCFAPPAAAAGPTGDAMPPSRREDPSPLGAFSPFVQHFTPEKPDDINEGLREAIKAGDVSLCKELIAANADPNYRDRQGNTPLHMAALFQRTEVAKALLIAGSDLTLKNGAGELPERMASVSLKMKFNTFKQKGEI